jgi:hypothetical protein
MAQKRTPILAQRRVDETRFQLYAVHPGYSIRIPLGPSASFMGTRADASVSVPETAGSAGSALWAAARRGRKEQLHIAAFNRTLRRRHRALRWRRLSAILSTRWILGKLWD